jgi:prolipoprotein diacylglyceryltransferase
MAALGLIFGLLLIVKLGREQGLDPEKLWNLGLIAILSGILGAKILYLITDAEARQNIFSLATLQAGGVWSGGFLLALVMCIWYMRATTCRCCAPAMYSRRAWRWDMHLDASAVSLPAVAMGARRTCPGP